MRIEGQSRNTARSCLLKREHVSYFSYLVFLAQSLLVSILPCYTECCIRDFCYETFYLLVIFFHWASGYYMMAQKLYM